LKRTKEKEWVHITCALFSKEYSIVDARKMSFTSGKVGVKDEEKGIEVEEEEDTT
jgi:hypothetical protein